MDYEKMYKETLERAKIWQEHLNEAGDKDFADELNYIFPELKESEDEKIRKMIINQMERWHKAALENNAVQDIKDSADAITWLEKQDKQKHIEKDLEMVNPSDKAEQKPAWSEEDERIYQSIIDDTVQENQLDSKQIDWLKSLKQRYTWKPRDEQMKALDSAIDEFDGYQEYDSLVSLKKDLEKLKGE